MLLFHGTRKPFERFDRAYYDTGENSVGIGFYFTDNLKGAYNHATAYALKPGTPLVYICKIREEALVLNLQHSIEKQALATQRHWETLPVENYCSKFDIDWFGSLLDGISREPFMERAQEKSKYQFLKERGFQVLYDTEGGNTDPYLHGTTIVVLDESVIDIIEVLPCEQLIYECMGERKDYVLADHLSELGETGLKSYLRRKVS